MRNMRPAWLVAAALAFASPIGAGPDAVQSALATAAAAAERGDGIAAEAALQKAMDAGAARGQVAARMGQALLLQGDLRKAREWLAPGQFSQQDSALGWRMTGLMLRQEGRLAEAGQAYDRALAVQPDDALLWVDIARLRYVGGEHVPAIQAAERALALAPDNPRAIELRAQLLIDQAGPVAAIPLLERGLEVAPKDVSLLTNYAAALGEAGRAVDMLKAVRRISELNSRSPVPLYFQAVIAARAGQSDLARNLLTRLGNQLAEVPAALLLQAALELEAGNSAMAVDMLERLDRRQPYNPRVQLLLARGLLEIDDHTRLRQRFGYAAAQPDASPNLLTIMGRSFERTGDRAAAAAYLDRAARADLLPLVARAAPDGVLPGSFDSLVQTGDRALTNGRAGEAVNAYQRAAQVRFPDWLLLHTVAALPLADGRVLAQRYQAAFPGSVLAARMLATAAGQGGRWGEARRLLENINRRSGGADPRLLADLSLAQLQSGDAEAALASAERASRLHRSSPLVAEVRGLALAQLGRDPAVAADLLEKAAALGRDDPLLSAAREKLDGG